MKKRNSDQTISPITEQATMSTVQRFMEALARGTLKSMAKDEYYSIEEVAKMLKVAYLTVYRWIQSGKLKAVKAGKQYRIEKYELDRFMKKQE